MKKTDAQPHAVEHELTDRNQLPAKIYKFRILGMGLGSIAISVVLIENQVSMVYWVWLLASLIIWPHLAFQFAQRQIKPYRAERNNLLFDSFIAGTWISMVWFNLLPAVLLIVTTTADKANTGLKNLWLYSLPVVLLGSILGLLLTGFEFQPVTSMNVILASLPLMVVHITLVSLGSYQLIRKLQIQNVLFKNLSQKDTLTQLYNRRHWQHQVDLLLQQIDKHSSLTLALIDIDHFKQMNDMYGHSTGDEILLAIAEVIFDELPAHAIAGRFGGDEFAIVMHKNHSQAKQVAAAICQQVADLKLENIDQLNCTVSIGLSELKDHEKDFRSWFDRADKNLYQAKHAGRNQIS